MVRSLVYSVLALFLGCSGSIGHTINYDSAGIKHETYSTSDGVASWKIVRNPGGRVTRQRVVFSDPREAKSCKNYAIVRDSSDEIAVTFRVESADSDCKLGDLETRFWATARLANKYYSKPVSRD